MSYDRRKKASDLFLESEPVIGKKVSFEEAFPEIGELNVKVTEIGRGTDYKEHTINYSKADFPGQFIDCSNPLCYGGGFSIGRIIRNMVDNRETELETTEHCKGYEGSPKGRRKYRECTDIFKVKVNIDYKE